MLQHLQNRMPPEYRTCIRQFTAFYKTKSPVKAILALNHFIIDIAAAETLFTGNVCECVCVWLVECVRPILCDSLENKSQCLLSIVAYLNPLEDARRLHKYSERNVCFSIKYIDRIHWKVSDAYIDPSRAHWASRCASTSILDNSHKERRARDLSFYSSHARVCVCVRCRDNSSSFTLTLADALMRQTHCIYAHTFRLPKF